MPIATITRQIGSDGDEIEPGAPEVQEKQPSFWERLNEERRRHSIMLRSAVYSFALEDDCVIVGVGGSILLKGLSHVLKVLTIADFDVRVNRTMEEGSLDRAGPITSREAAIEMVRAKDR